MEYWAFFWGKPDIILFYINLLAWPDPVNLKKAHLRGVKKSFIVRAEVRVFWSPNGAI